MSEELRKKLSEELEICSWSILKEHHSRNVVFVINEELDLVEVAISLALDEVDKVKTWKDAGDFREPDSYEIKKWNEDPDKKIATFIIVQPFVLIQKMVQQ